ncbi:peroxisome assembly protein 26 [Brachyhypopomus gauderio]|uniref:peroxisome assembly protein 26 n=1 Tax=Brachyhypopomus gauderio TaxID=698409 RepID=UPI00404237A2
MRSGSLAPGRLCSPPVCSLTHRAGLVDIAIEHLMVRKDFHSAFDTCEKGLNSLASDEQDETCSRHGDLKAALCIVGIQALAELNQWQDVFTWVLKHYSETEKIPAKIMQMCILLYTKVAEQATVQEAVRSWLHCSSNMGQAGFSSVAELYVLHVLLPLGRTAEAVELLEDEVGQVAFTQDQRHTALTIVKSHDAEPEPLSHPNTHPDPVEAETAPKPQGSLVRRLNAVLRLLYRSLSIATTSVSSNSLHRALLLLFMIYLLLIRMDPALPSAFPWIHQLYRLFQQMWNAMFGPYYRVFS